MVAAAALWFVTLPKPLSEADVAGLTGDAARGEAVFWASGCASCHMAADAKDEAQLVLKGGQRFPSDFGTFIAPNISQDPEARASGTGAFWTWPMPETRRQAEGQHLYPALPYASYARWRCRMWRTCMPI
jgi:cytochrome c peroxidase